MPMRFLDTKRRGDTRRFTIWLDTSRTVVDPATGAAVPDPDWTASIDFPATPPAGMAAGAYRDMIVGRVQAFARQALADKLAAQPLAGSDLAVAGTDFV
jgi:hypothetical protein